MEKRRINSPHITDIARSAKLLISQLEVEAYDYAVERMQRLMTENDAKGAGVWLAIAHDIKQLQVPKDNLI